MAGTAFAGMPTTQFGQLSPAAYGAYGFGGSPFGAQSHPYLQSLQQGSFGYGGISSPFGTQTVQLTPQQQQLLHIPQQLQQLQYLQQHLAVQIQQLGQQLLQIQQLLQLLPQQIQQLQQQLPWQQSGGIQSFSGPFPFSSPQTGGGPWSWPTPGQPGLGPQTFASQGGPVM